MPPTTFAGSVRLTIPGRKGTSWQQPDVTVQLPSGAETYNEEWVFDDGHEGIVSVIVEAHGKSAKEQFELESKDFQGQAISAGPTKGFYEEQMLSDNVRRGRLYYLYNDPLYYTMMISWPDGNEQAKADAERLAQFVIWSIKPTKTG